MSSVSHVSTVDRGLKMKIKRTKVGPNSAKNDSGSKQESAQKGDSAGGTTTAQHGSAGLPAVNGVPGSTSGVTMDTKPAGSAGSSTPTKAGACGMTLDSAKDKSPKVKTPVTKKEKNKEKSGAALSKPQSDSSSASSNSVPNGSSSVSVGSVVPGSTTGSSVTTSGPGLTCSLPNGLDMYPHISLEPRVAVEAVSVKREVLRPVLDVMDDPYEFNAKVEDGLCPPPKKLKTDTKVDSACSPSPSCSQDAATETCSQGSITEPELLGPCEPGTSVTLQGIVWQEQTDNGLLVVNVTWRDRTYVGTLLDVAKNEWAPPRPNCDSPVSDFETRTPKGRGKRGRAAAGTPSSDRSIAEGRKLRKTRRGSNNNFPAPASPARPDNSSVKRKGRTNEESDSNKTDKGNGPSNSSSNKRNRSCSRGGASGTESPPPPTTIECPEPNCKKKYKHINGLRYHQTHAHQQPSSAADDDKDDEEDMDVDSRESRKGCEARDGKKDQQVSERAERAKAKEQRLQREKQREKSLEKDCSAVEDNIPLKAFASKLTVSNGDKPVRSEVGPVKSVEVSGVGVSSVPPTMINTPLAMPSTTLTTTTVSAKKKDGGPSMSVNLAVSKTAGAPGQVHQLAGVGCVSGLPVMTSCNTVQAPVIAVPPASVATTTSAPIPITVGPLGSLDIKDKIDKAKNKMTARPIIPAPSPMSMGSPGAAGPGVGSSSVHPPVSQGLKMIQPKPTIMGEYSSVNPSLVDLKEKRKAKKKKEKEGAVAQGQPGMSSPLSKVSKEEVGRCDRPAVIKSVAPSPGPRHMDGIPRNPDGIPSIEVSRPVDSPHPSLASLGQPCMTSSQMAKNSGDQMRSVQPPGLLKVNSPLHISAGERKTPVTDDVQSPAYSDISDANDSSSPQQHESPKKDRDVTTKKDDNSSSIPQGDGAAVAPSHFGGMYYFNRPSPYLSPNVNAPHPSPNSNKSLPQKDGDNPPDDARPSASNEAGKTPNDGSNPEHKDSTPKGPVSNKPEAPASQQQLPPSQQQQATPTQQQLYQQQQVEWQQNFLQLYSRIRYLPQQTQYQYLAHYGMLEPYAQCILSQQDPIYRQIIERISQEQKRLQEQQQGGGGKRPESTETPTRKPGSRPPSVDRHSSTPEAGPSGPGGPVSGPKLPQPLYGPGGPVPDRLHEGKSVSDSGDDKESREQQTLREKQNENHQILKENIELKSQMDRGRQEIDLNRQKQEDRRMMFFQQKQIEQQRSEKRKLEMHGKPPELKSNLPSGLLPMDAARHSGLPVGAIKTEDIKKEPVDHNRMKDSSSSRIPDVKSGDDKKASVDKGRSVVTDGAKSKHDQSGIPVSVPTSINPPTGPPGQYPSYTFPVLPSHYGPMQVDPSHPMYRQMAPHMIGYAAPGPPAAYIHPSQLGYRMGPPHPIDADKDVGKGDSKPSGPPPPSSEDSGKGGGSSDGSQPHFYSPSMHKIHELAQEKARVRPGSGSPAPSKADGESRSTGGISALSSGDKQRSSPPTQRHLHTHHHTHVLSHGFYPPDPSFAMFAANAHGQAPNAPPPALQPPAFNK